MKKLDDNPVAVAEQGIAALLADDPAISALLDGGRGAGAVPVFSATDESASALLRKGIESGLKQAVVVAFQRTVDAASGATGLPVRCAFGVTVSSPGMLAENAIRSTTDIGCAVIRALDGVQFAEPFVPRMPVRFTSWNHSADANGRLVATLEFEAALFLNPI